MNELTQAFFILGIITIFLVAVIVCDKLIENKEIKLRKQEDNKGV
jgi:hypothetical protein